MKRNGRSRIYALIAALLLAFSGTSGGVTRALAAEAAQEFSFVENEPAPELNEPVSESIPIENEDAPESSSEVNELVSEQNEDAPEFSPAENEDSEASVEVLSEEEASEEVLSEETEGVPVDALPEASDAVSSVSPTGFRFPTPISLSEEELGAMEQASGALENAAREAEYGASEWDKYVSHYFYKQLSEDEQTLYDNLTALCEEVFTSGTDYTNGRRPDDYPYVYIYALPAVSAPSSLSQQEIWNVMVLFMENNPQYYFLSSWYGGGNGRAVLYLLEEFNTGAERSSATPAIRSKLAGWVSQVEAQSGTLAKEKKAHDIVTSHITYNSADMDDPLNQSVYSAYKGKTVCTGYAKLFSMLCNAAGIDTQVVTSKSHAWGMVRAEGAWYYTDPTWDDQGSTSYKWFNRSASVALALDTEGAHQAESFYPLPAMSKDSGGTATLPAADGKLSDPIIAVTAYGTKYQVEITCPAGATLYYAARAELSGLMRLGQSWKTGISAASAVSFIAEDTPYIFAKAERKNYSDSALVSAYAPDSQAGESEEAETEWTRPEQTQVNVTLAQESFAYTGLAIKPEVTVTDGTKVLAEGEDFTVSYANNKTAAEASGKKPPTVTVKFKGNYSGSLKKTFTITAASLEDSSVKDQYNVGNTVLPAKTRRVKINGVSTQLYAQQWGRPVVWYCGKKLTLNRDYTLSYPERVLTDPYDQHYAAPGSYSILIEGKAPNFTGSYSVQQIIKEGSAEEPLINLGSAKVELYYNDKLLKGTNKIYYSPENTPHAKILVSYKDKTGLHYVSVSSELQGFYENDQAPGTVTLRLYPRSGSSLYGTKNVTYKVEAVDLAKAGDELQVELPSESVTYERTGAKPEPAVSYAGTVLTEGVDYKLSWSGNKKVTENAKLKVTGIGGFKGSVQKSFGITKKSLSDLSFYTEDLLWSGKQNAYQKARIIVSDENGAELKAGTDYTLSFSTLTGSSTPAVGERIWAQIEGKGNYTGTVLRSFKPAEASIAKGKLTLLDDAGAKAKNYSYEISPVTLTKSNLRFTLDGQQLTAEDYKISGFISNTDKGTAKVILEGKNAFGGMAVFNYSIAAKAVSQ